MDSKIDDRIDNRMDKELSGCLTLACAILIVILMVISFYVGKAFGASDVGKEAVKQGHAEYVLKGDKAVWQWKELK